MIVLNEEEGLECEVHIDGTLLKHFSELKYLQYFLDESGTGGTECSRKVGIERMMIGAIRSLINAMDMKLEFASLA